MTKRGTGPGTYEWVRHVLDVYGDPKQRLSKGDGPGHHIAVGDFDGMTYLYSKSYLVRVINANIDQGDGDEECLVALFGPNPGKVGVYSYRPIFIDYFS